MLSCGTIFNHTFKVHKVLDFKHNVIADPIPNQLYYLSIFVVPLIPY